MLLSLHITHSSTGGMANLIDIIPQVTEAVSEHLSTDGDVIEYVVVRTCNRMETYIHTHNGEGVRERLVEVVKNSSQFRDRQVWYFLENKECVKHLFTVVCGMDSLIVGEDQIQHQIKDSFETARQDGHVGKVLYTVFNNALIVGKRVRTETALNKGAVSVGYAAIELAERNIGSLRGKSIAIIGAGDMAGVIAKNLVGKGPETVIVSNRTFERAWELATELNGTAVSLSRMIDTISKSDLVLVATSAPHHVVRMPDIKSAMVHRPERPLLIIDVSVPVNTDPDVVKVPGVTLSTMASLDAIAAENVAKRKGEISKAEKIIAQELARIDKEEKESVANRVIRDVSIMCEDIRKEQMDLALAHLNNGDNPVTVINDMSRALVKMISADFIKNLRKAASEGDTAMCDAAAKLFAPTDKE